MKLAVVTPRYGVEVAAGAETARPAAGDAARDPSRIRRHRADHVRTRRVHVGRPLPGRRDRDRRRDRAPIPGHRARAPTSTPRTDLVVRRGTRVGDAEQRAWIDKQGPVAPGLIDAIAHCDADVIAFHRSCTTPPSRACPLSPARVLHPAAHDEPVLGLPIYRPVFGAAAGLAYWSEPERHLVEQRFRVASKPAVVVGLGVDAGAGDAAAASMRVGSTTGPTVVPRPRRRRQRRAAARRVLRPLQGPPARAAPARLRGPVANAPPPHPDIVTVGAVDEPQVGAPARRARAGLARARSNRSRSCSWRRGRSGTPALVNSRCAVTLDHVRRSGGGTRLR